MPKLRTVIESIDKIGEGVDGDPIRDVIRYYTIKGDLLAVNDSWKESRYSNRIKSLGKAYSAMDNKIAFLTSEKAKLKRDLLLKEKEISDIKTAHYVLAEDRDRVLQENIKLKSR